MWLATLFSILNKIFDLAPPLLIGAAVDVVVMQEKSVLSTYYAEPKEQLIILSILTVIIWVLESLFEYIYGVLWRNLAQSVSSPLDWSLNHAISNSWI
jgi:ATP-binding cassette subfamily B protein